MHEQRLFAYPKVEALVNVALVGQKPEVTFKGHAVSLYGLYNLQNISGEGGNRCQQPSG